MAYRILVLDTPAGALRPLEQAFRSAGGKGSEVKSVTTKSALFDKIGEGGWDLVVLDEALGDGTTSGLEVLSELRQRDTDIAVIAVAESGDVDRAARAIHAGASDFLVRTQQLGDRVSTQLAKIRQLLKLIDRNRALSRENERLKGSLSSTRRIVGQSVELDEVLQRIERIAKVPRPVLIEGERGTGKELVARAIHDASGASGSFVCVNCAAFADALLESELFGHERGAFTGAERQVRGKFELASGGTLFLDEIGNMSLPFQQKILRAVEYGTFLRVGGSEEIRVRTRIVAATNADLRRNIDGGKFLVDLYDRLAFEVIRVPPLRERRGDIAVLAQHFLEQFMREVPAFQGKRLSPDGLALLESYAFPGNVRELKNIIERAVYRDTTSVITPEDIGLLPETTPRALAGAFKQRVDGLERELIESALAQSGGNQAEAARRLGLSYHQFRYYHAKYFG